MNHHSEKCLADVINDTIVKVQDSEMLADKRVASLLGCWIAGTYAHSAFNHYGLLLHRSPA